MLILWLTLLTMTLTCMVFFKAVRKESISMRSLSLMVKESPVVAPWVGAMEIMSMLMPKPAIFSKSRA